MPPPKIVAQGQHSGYFFLWFPKSGVGKLDYFVVKALLLPVWSSVGAAGRENRAQQFDTNKGLFVKQGSGWREDKRVSNSRWAITAMMCWSPTLAPFQGWPWRKSEENVTLISTFFSFIFCFSSFLCFSHSPLLSSPSTKHTHIHTWRKAALLPWAAAVGSSHSCRSVQQFRVHNESFLLTEGSLIWDPHWPP